jgi:NADPH:quinone reductase-like Zn-dependent oxidoreductase
LTFERAPVPVAALGEVLIAVHAAAITFDELSTVPAADLARRPTTVCQVVSAALPLAGLTAWQALVDHAQVREGERVLVHGGAGGVGALTVGGETLDRSSTVLRPGGRLVTLTAPPPRQDGTHRPRPAKGDNGVRP